MTAQVAEDIIQEPSLGPRRKEKRVEVSCGSSSDLLNDSEHLKQALLPQHQSNALHYNVQVVPEEIVVAKSFLGRKRPEAIPDILSVFKLLDPMIFP